MHYGTEAHFVERTRAARRVASIAFGLAAVLLLPILATYLPPLREPMARLRRDVRFGIRGEQERYVRRIQLEADQGRDNPVRELGKVQTRSERRGGTTEPRRATHVQADPEYRPPIEGEGESFENRLARAMARRSDVPIVLADQLVIDRLVRPVYPAEALEKNIIGRVAVLALVDTSGAVVSADVLTPSGSDQIDVAAASAVLQCRFKPYRVDGQAREVHVVMPFNFSIR